VIAVSAVRSAQALFFVSLVLIAGGRIGADRRNRQSGEDLMHSDSKSPMDRPVVEANETDFSEGTKMLAQSKEEVATELTNLVRECKAFLKSTAGLSSETVAEAREKLAAKLADAKDRWRVVSQTARVKGRRTALAADDYVRTRPWLAMGLAAGLAFMIASLATRR
jgi:ElaB/YqjD/DUF883 family membrane-anchored ribosome-binding protein